MPQGLLLLLGLASRCSQRYSAADSVTSCPFWQFAHKFDVAGASIWYGTEHVANAVVGGRTGTIEEGCRVQFADLAWCVRHLPTVARSTAARMRTRQCEAASVRSGAAAHAMRVMRRDAAFGAPRCGTLRTCELRLLRNTLRTFEGPFLE